MDLQSTRALADDLRAQVRRVVMGHDDVMDLLLIALLAEGHVLLEGPPGTGKTLLAKAFSVSLGLKFRRVQFTPDLLPGDLIGTNLFNFQTNEFTLTKGPLFTEFLLADEINRTPPKTQAALLQAMQEREVTIDGAPHDLGAGFLVVATQNPIEHEGTYPLPEAQLDRFLFKVTVGYPTREKEIDLVRLHGHRTASPKLDDHGVAAIASLDQLVAARRVISTLRASDEILEYVVDLIRATRESDSLNLGASPRAANMLLVAARGAAALDGRDYVIPDDVKRMAPPLLRHRVVLSPSAELEGLDSDTVVRRVIGSVPAPR